MSGFGFKIEAADFLGLNKDIEAEIAAKSMRAMDRATVDVKDDLGEQMRQAGFSARFSKAWDRTVYPGKGRSSLSPAGVVRSKAPEIIDAFTRGATIRPVNGPRYLWLPTKFVPKARRRVSLSRGVLRGGAMTPEEVEDRFGDFIYLHEKGGGLGAYVQAIQGRNGRSERKATGRRIAQGRAQRLVKMFSLRRTVKMPKSIELDISAQRGAAAYARHFNAEMAKS